MATRAWMPSGIGVGWSTKLQDVGSQLNQMEHASNSGPVLASGFGAFWRTRDMSTGIPTVPTDEEKFAMHRQREFNLNTPFNFNR
jgi:hypothetical protein